MKWNTARLALHRVRSLRGTAGAKKSIWNSILAPQSSSFRCLSSARPLPTKDEITESEWQKKVNALKKAASQSPLPPTTPGSSNAKVSSTSPAEVTVHLRDNNSDNDNNNEKDTSYASTNTLTYTGGASMPVTTKLHIVTPEEDTPRGKWPVFRLMDDNGQFRDPSMDGKEGRLPMSSPFTRKSNDEHNLGDLRSFLVQEHPYHQQELERSGLLQTARNPFADTNSNNTLLRAHRQLVRLREMDFILLNAQRQGRISFYMTCRGEEAIHMGAASALDLGDPIFAQYREQGLLMWRGFTLEQFTNQCFSNEMDLGKGRQMPVHYGSRALNYHTVSSPLGTQMPQAVGAAYRLKLSGKKNVAICFFGEGCASTTDFHSALNFAATLESPVVFLCRNNGYAISTSVKDQYRGDGIISRGPGYGIASIRIDGSDIFAIHAAVRDAKEYALKHNAPVLIEAMCYRMGHHSTSDDSSRYRSTEEVKDFEKRSDPIARLEKFLKHNNWLTDDEAATIKDEEKIAVMRALEQAERRPGPALESLFEDVYHEMPPHLQEQQAKLREHIAKYPKSY